MTKAKARKCLENYLKNNVCKLPITDAIVIKYSTPFEIADMSFLGLLCIAYDLRPAPKQKQ
jgi:hypothetical protein